MKPINEALWRKHDAAATGGVLYVGGRGVSIFEEARKLLGLTRREAGWLFTGAYDGRPEKDLEDVKGRMRGIRKERRG